MDPARAAALLDFLALADRLKTVERRGLVPLPDGSLRRENSAEHCWNLALLALLLHREVAAEVDLGHALSLIAVHDLVEVEAADVENGKSAWGRHRCSRSAGTGSLGLSR